MYPFRYVPGSTVRMQLNAQMTLFDSVSAAALWSLQQVWRMVLPPSAAILRQRPGWSAPGACVNATAPEAPPAVRGPAAMVRAAHSGMAAHRDDEASRIFRHAFRAHGIHTGGIDGAVRWNDKEADAAVDLDGPAGTISAQGHMQGNRVR